MSSQKQPGGTRSSPGAARSSQDQPGAVIIIHINTPVMGRSFKSGARAPVKLMFFALALFQERVLGGTAFGGPLLHKWGAGPGGVHHFCPQPLEAMVMERTPFGGQLLDK